MGWFTKNKTVPKVKTDIGTFAFDGTGWSTESPNADQPVTFVVTSDELDIRAVDHAQALRDRRDKYVRLALDYAKNDRSVWDGSYRLSLESIDITELVDENKFGLTFGTEEAPDFTLTVEFQDDAPYEVWTGD